MMIRPLVLASGIHGMMNSVRHLALLSTSKLSRTTLSHCETEILRLKSERVRMRSVQRSDQSWMGRRRGRMLQRGYPNSKDKRWTKRKRFPQVQTCNLEMTRHEYNRESLSSCYQPIKRPLPSSGTSMLIFPSFSSSNDIFSLISWPRASTASSTAFAFFLNLGPNLFLSIST